MGKKIDGGAVIWARKTIESDVFYTKPDKWFKIWFYLVCKANHKDTKRFLRGSCFMKYEWIMENTKATRSEVDHCMRWLKSATMIATRKATRGFTLDVLSYDDHQNLNNYKSDSKSDGKSEVKAKQKRNKSDTKDKNVKNGKNGNKILSQIEKLKLQFPSEIKSLIEEYIEVAKLENETNKIQPNKERRLINELLLIWIDCDHEINKKDFEQALKVTLNNKVANPNYVRKVIKSREKNRKLKLQKANKIWK